LILFDNIPDNVVGSIQSATVTVTTTGNAYSFDFTDPLGGLGPFNIPDNDAVVSVARIGGSGLSDPAAWVNSIVNVTIDINGLTHPATYELGSSVTYDLGGSKPNYDLLNPRGNGGASNVDLTFSDIALFAVPDPMTSGTYYPYDWELTGGGNTLTSFFKKSMGNGSCLG